MSHAVPSFVSSRSFARALGRIGAALPAFDEAMRHAVYHATQGQTTPLARLVDAAKLGGHVSSESWRLCLSAVRTALAGYVVERTGPAWDAKPEKQGGKRLSPAEAEALAASLPPLAAAVEASRAEAAAKREAGKLTREATKKAAEEEKIAKAAAAQAKGLAFDAEAESLLEKLSSLIAADLASISRRADDVAAAQAKGLAGDTVPPAALRLVPMLAGMPQALLLLSGALTAAAALAESVGAAAEAAKTREAVDSFNTARTAALEIATSARKTRDHAAAQCKAAQAEADSLTAEALALAEQAAVIRSGAAAAAEAAGAARTAELLAAAGGAGAAGGVVRAKRSRAAPALAS